MDDLKGFDYDSPISTVISTLQPWMEKFGEQFDALVIKNVCSVGINIDKDKLLQALNQDKSRYEEAYRRGYAARENEIIRCKDCKHCFVDGENVRYNVCELNHNKVQADDWFCADAERKEEDEE